MSKRGKILIAVSIAVIIAAVAAVAAIFVISQDPASDDNVIVNPDVIIYEEGESPFKIVASTDSDITVSNASGIKVGNIIASDATSAAPDGLLRRVTGMGQGTDGNTVLSTRPAALTEAIDYCDVHQTITLNDNGTYTLEQDGTGGNTPFSIEKAYADSLDNVFSESFGAIDCAGGVQFDLDLEIQDGEIKMAFYLHAQSELSLGSCSIGFDEELFSWDKPCTFMIGPVPVVISNEFSVNLEASAAVAGMTPSFAVIFDRKVGFEYSSQSGLSPINEDDSRIEDNTVYSEDAVCFAEYMAALPIEYGAYVYGLAGPTIQVAVDADYQQLLKVLPVGEDNPGAISVPGTNRKFSGQYLFRVTLPISGHFKLKIPDFNPFSDDDFELADVELFNSGDLITLINEYYAFGTMPDKPYVSQSNFKGNLADAITGNPGGTDILLVLDTSSSMYGDPIDAAKEAASSFVDNTVAGKTRVGVVTYSGDAELESAMTDDSGSLKDTIDDIGTFGGTNIESGLRTAFDTLKMGDASKKAIVLMSDGAPTTGLQGDDLVEYAATEKGDPSSSSAVRLYTLGFNEDAEGAALLAALADAGRHYEISDSSDLTPFFADIADEINGERFIYSRIACPVDVKVTYQGETLDSATQSNRTSFGSLSYEDEVDDNGKVVEEDAIKILRLREGADYDIDLTGTGTGTMTYTVGVMDADGNYSDVRNFPNVPVSAGMHAVAQTNPSEDSVLKVDYDNNGRYEVVYRAEPNSSGVLVDNSGAAAFILWACFGIAVLVCVMIVLLTGRRIMRARKAAPVE